MCRSILILSLFITLLSINEEGYCVANAHNKKVMEISKQIKCLVCHGESIKDSTSMFADNLRKVIEEQVALGKEGDEILIYLKSKYGEEISLAPAFGSNTIVLWLLPLSIAAFGLILIIKNNWFYKKSK